MSVYKTPKSRFWQFDFVISGRRFHGSTGQTTRRAAEAVERQRRLEAATGQFGAVAKMTIDQAAGRYWAEVGIDRGDAKDVERRLENLVALIGKTRLLGDIDQAVIAGAIERRRGQALVRSKKDGAKQYLPSNSTVNRDVVETLRPILRRARTHWATAAAPHGLPDIDWTALRLKEPRALSRLYSDAERARWIHACDEDVRLALDIMLTYGLRFGELLFPPAALSLDGDEPTLTLQKGRKKDVLLHLPLRQDHARNLAARLSRAIEAELPHLWYFQGAKKLEAYTYAQIEYRFSKAADQAGISGGRRIHGARHHAASTILKRTRNLKAVQSLLGHATINSSQRYAHVLTSDLRAALEDDIPRNSPGADAPDSKQTKAR
ncbi:MAG: tyrosine-type recombinase/integrase [Caulobacter sp.]|nr:tyrosine-type recombinase/integrase [Caulobacter sp.]